MRGFDPQESAGPAEIHEIYGRPDPRPKPARGIEEMHRIERGVAEHGDVHVAVGA
jgi:hypothetical protein